MGEFFSNLSIELGIEEIGEFSNIDQLLDEADASYLFVEPEAFDFFAFENERPLSYITGFRVKSSIDEDSRIFRHIN